MTDKERKKYTSQNGSQYGYIVEWRLKPESVVLKDMFTKLYDPHGSWKQPPYSIEDLVIVGELANTLVRPKIAKCDSDLARYDLVRRNVAEAILACLKTTTSKKLLKHVEWRISRMKLEHSYSVVFDDDGQEQEENRNAFRDAVEEM